MAYCGRRLWDRWRHLLPAHVYDRMWNSKRITVWEGDIKKAQQGLDATATRTLLHSISIAIHCASSINLRHDLGRIAPDIIHPTLELAQLMLSGTAFKRFVYISSAYANAHLHQLHDGIDTEVLEQIYPLRNTQADTSAYELLDVTHCGSTPEYAFHNFPAAYCYAKHLTERLLLARFQACNRQEDLLIMRPAILGPALTEPVRGFQIGQSTPATGLCAAMVTCMDWELRLASRLPEPEKNATLDEVPVDIAANRILVHLITGSSGCVHAVAGRERISLADVYRRTMAYRRLPWQPRLRFQAVDWHSQTLSPIARLFTILGTSYLFDEGKTRAVWAKMSAEERGTWPLFLRCCKAELDAEAIAARRTAVRALIQGWLERKKGIPGWGSYLIGTLLV